MRSRILITALAVGFVACASARSGFRTRMTGPITAEAIAGITAMTAYDAVEKLRRTWLVARGPKSLFVDPSPAYPVVLVDGVWAGELIFLESIGASDIAEIRFLSAIESAGLYGPGYPGGIIQVTTRSR